MTPVTITDQNLTSPHSKTNSKLREHSVVVEQLTEVAQDILEQAIDLLKNTLTGNDQLTYVSKFIPGSTIGKHLRHARDHYVLLAKSITDSDSSLQPGCTIAARLSYDTRIRDTPMETSIAAGLQAFEEIIEALNEIAEHVPEDKPILLTADTGPYQQTINSTFGRELWFCSLHAIHHWSMVRVIACELGCVLGPNFGVAPSTINHRDKAKM